MADDDLLRAEEIESLVKSTAAGQPGGMPAPPAAPGAEAAQRASGSEGGTTAERLLEQAEADLRAAVAPILNPARGLPPELGQPKQFAFPPLGSQRSAAGDDLTLQ